MQERCWWAACLRSVAAFPGIAATETGGALLQPRQGGRQGWAPPGWEQTRGLSPIPGMQILGILQSPQRSWLLAEPLLWVGAGTGTGRRAQGSGVCKLVEVRTGHRMHKLTEVSTGLRDVQACGGEHGAQEAGPGAAASAPGPGGTGRQQQRVSVLRVFGHQCWGSRGEAPRAHGQHTGSPGRNGAGANTASLGRAGEGLAPVMGPPMHQHGVSLCPPGAQPGGEPSAPRHGGSGAHRGPGKRQRQSPPCRGCAAHPAVAVTQQHFHSPSPRKPPGQAASLALTLLPLPLPRPPARAVPRHAVPCGCAGAGAMAREQRCHPQPSGLACALGTTVSCAHVGAVCHAGTRTGPACR